MKISTKCVYVIVILVVLASSGCAAISPYITKAAEVSIDASTKTLEASIFYIRDRSKSGDLIRRYPDPEELIRHFKWCAAQKKQPKTVAPRLNNE